MQRCLLGQPTARQTKQHSFMVYHSRMTSQHMYSQGNVQKQGAENNREMYFKVQDKNTRKDHSVQMEVLQSENMFFILTGIIQQQRKKEEPYWTVTPLIRDPTVAFLSCAMNDAKSTQ